MDLKKAKWFGRMSWERLAGRQTEAPWIPDVADQWDCSYLGEEVPDAQEEGGAGAGAGGWGGSGGAATPKRDSWLSW
jgi:hypothetical protein